MNRQIIEKRRIRITFMTLTLLRQQIPFKNLIGKGKFYGIAKDFMAKIVHS